MRGYRVILAQYIRCFIARFGDHRNLRYANQRLWLSAGWHVHVGREAHRLRPDACLRVGRAPVARGNSEVLIAGATARAPEGRHPCSRRAAQLRPKLRPLPVAA